jgi:hypothetical protein
MLGKPVKADPEIAAARFAADLATLWATGRPERLGWSRRQLDGLHAVVAIPAKRQDGTIDVYHIKLGAEYYDAFPPTAAFIVPESLALATANSRWLPSLAAPPWFGLHPSYTFPGELQPRQLLCFTFTAEYYMIEHNPPESTIWQQGRHTVAATTSRLAELLQPPLYLGPSGS